MKHSEHQPEWYDALRVNPFRSKTFTTDIAAGVRRRIVVEPAGRQSDRRIARSWLRIALAASLGGSISAAVVLTAVGPGSPEAGSLLEQSAAADGNRQRAASSVVAPFWPGDRPSLPVQSPDDSQWQALIDASYPESKVSMLHKKALQDDVMLVLSRKVLSAEGYLSASLVVDEFVWSGSEWKSQARVGYHPGDNLLEYSGKGLLTGWSGISLDSQDSGQFVTMFYGIIADPAIVDIRVTDDGGRVHAASVHDAGDGFAYWFAALPPGEKGSYTVTGAFEDGTLLHEEFYYYR
jgi:hypothetical protein